MSGDMTGTQDEPVLAGEEKDGEWAKGERGEKNKPPFFVFYFHMGLPPKSDKWM